MTKYWWNKKWGSDKICGITHSRIRPGKNKNGVHYSTTLKCGHSFYTNALLKWTETCGSYPTCPLCRADFTFIDLIQ